MLDMGGVNDLVKKFILSFDVVEEVSIKLGKLRLELKK